MLTRRGALSRAQAVEELRALFALADAYGIAGYLQFDASCVRGLSYYTGARRAPPRHAPRTQRLRRRPLQMCAASAC